MKTIDNEVLAGYNAGIEKGRLRTGLGLIEFERTKEIIKEMLPAAPAVIYDISEKNIEIAIELSQEYSQKPKVMEVADAITLRHGGKEPEACVPWVAEVIALG